VTLARRIAESQNNQRLLELSQLEEALDESRLVKEDFLPRSPRTETEKEWLRNNRTEDAAHWNLLTCMRPEEFLAGIDQLLNEPLVLHCVGGFVVTLFYGFPRTTGDLDYYTALPSNFNLLEVAGEGPQLHKRYGISLHKAAVTNLPEEYETRSI
jgi:hypothetical protein